MSKTIEEKVVEMRFDNRHFENNVKTTMSTLDKLKQKLHFSTSTKGLENVSQAASKVNMNGLSSALTTVQSKFSALEVVGITALANITNSAVNAGKRMVHALTVAPVSDGWREYEMTLNAVQTTMAGTGKSAKEVEQELKKLDEYADKTVYSTSDMLNNLPKFTNAGVKLEAATSAMIGIANATALAGGDANKASIAFYNLGQAIGTGYLTRMDYNSINNAGIATMEWKNAMVEAAIAAGTLKKVGDDQYKAGNKTLSLQQLFIDGLQEQWATTEVMMKVFQDYGDETTEIGKKAYSAAQDIKTFSMMMDSLKATAGTGWKDTWQIIFGGLDEAKEFWTGLNNFISKIITTMANFRNKLLESALGKNFVHLLDRVKDSANSVKKIVDSVKDYTQVVDEIIAGKWGNTEKRWNALTAAGYDWAHAQNLVNERLGFSLRRATNYSAAQKEVNTSQKKTMETTADFIVSLIKLSDAQLKAKGYTDEQIKAFRELETAAKKTGIPLKEFIENIDEIDGRYLLINSFKNLGLSLVSVFKSIGEAWKNAFPPMTGDQLFDIIAAMHKFSVIIRTRVEKNADSLTRTLKGLFAILDLISMVIGGGLKIAFTILKAILGAFNLNLLDFTALIGDAIVRFRDWVEENNLVIKVIKKLAEYIKVAVIAIKDWIVNNKTISKGIENFKNSLKDIGKYIKNWLSDLEDMSSGIKNWIIGLKDANDIPKYIFEGLINGLRKGAGTVIEFIMEFGKKILSTIKKILGIHSPSKEFFEIGQNITQGLYNGISGSIKMVYDLLMSVGRKLIEIITNLDIGSIFTIAIGAGSVYGIVSIAKALETLTSPMEVFADIGETFNKTLKKFNGVLTAFKFRLYAESLKSVAIAIAILAGSVIALSLVEPGKLWAAIGAVAALAVVLGALTVVSGKLGGKEGVQFGKLALTLLALSVSMAIMALALKSISKIDPNKGVQTLLGFVGIVGAMIAVIAVSNKTKSGFLKLGAAFMGMASALLIMAWVAKILGGMDKDTLIQGELAIITFSAIIIGLMACTKLLTGSKNVDKIGGTLARIASAILMMALVARLLGTMDPSELAQGVQAIVLFSAIIVGLMAATKLINGSKNVNHIGKAIAGIAGAMLMMAVTARILGTMDPVALLKGVGAVAALTAIVSGLVWATKLAGKDLERVGRTVLMLSISVGILGLTAALLSLIDVDGLMNGVAAVGILTVFMMGLLAVTSLVPQGIMGTLITLTVIIGILAVALGIMAAIKPDRLKGATIAISMVLGLLAIVIAATSLVPTAMKTLIVIGVIITLLAGALIGLANLPVDSVLGAAKGLSAVLLSIAGMLGILALVGLGGPAALIGVASLAAAIVGIGALVIAIGALMDHFPKLEEFLNKGIPILEKIGYAIGSFFGNIISGFATAATSGLPEIGLMLSQFMFNVTPFIEGMKLVDSKTLAGVGILAAAILALTAANLINSIASFLTLGSSFADLGTQLSQFMINALPFITTAMLIQPGITESVKTLAETILILTGANFIERINAFLGGGSSLEKFGTQLTYLATGIKGFISELGPLSPEQIATAKNAAEITKVLAAAAKEIPNAGGLLGKLVGNNDMGPWAKQLPIMASGIVGFIKVLQEAELDASSLDIANTAANIIKSLATAAKEIPNAGGFLADLIGDNKLSTFASEFPKVGKGIVGFIKAMSEGSITTEQAEVANTAAKIIKTLATAAKEIPNAGGFLAGLVGDNKLSTFASEFPKVGQGIADFVSKIGTLDDGKTDAANTAIKLLKVIVNFGKTDMSNVSTNLINIGNSLSKFGSKVSSFITRMAGAGAESIDSAITNFEKIIDLIPLIANVDAHSINEFADSLKKLAKTGVKDFIKEFSGTAPKTEAKKGAKELVQAVIDGMDDFSKKVKLKSVAKSLAKDAVEAMSKKSLKNDAAQAGKDLCQGLINGLKDKDKRTAVYNAAFSLGQLAVQGEKDGQESHSPSKATERAGKWLGEGLIIGMKKMTKNVYGAGEFMGEEAKNSISGALDTALNLLNTDMDAQPTIRPVLDLSDVKSGAGYINSMFNNGPSVGLVSNLSAISSGMNARSQNGTNGDVVSAINKLRKDLGNVGGTTNNYNVNGVTYDDGSNITDAVRTIVRAAKMERRV
jgi:hypothetical protein